MTPPNSIECREAAARLYEYLDGELNHETEAEVRAHLADCVKCFSLYGFEDAYLAFVRARTQARTAPEHLRKKIFEQIILADKESPERE
jgi:anti-sigma factor (TIGR02949 family)